MSGQFNAGLSGSSGSSGSSDGLGFEGVPNEFDPTSWSDTSAADAGQSADSFEAEVEAKIARKKEKVEESIANDGTLQATEANGKSYGSIKSAGAREAISNVDSDWRDTTNSVDTQNEVQDVVDNTVITADKAQDAAQGAKETADNVVETVGNTVQTATSAAADVSPSMPSLPDNTPLNLPSAPESDDGIGVIQMVMLAVAVVGAVMLAGDSGGSQ